MGTRWIVVEAFGHHFALVAGWLGTPGASWHRLEPRDAERQLDLLLHGGHHRAVARMLAPDGEAAPLEGEALVERARQRVRDGRITVFEIQAQRPVSDMIPLPVDVSDLIEGAADLLESEPAPAPEPAHEPEPEPEPESQTFVAFRLIDASGAPISDRAFTLEVPDGRTVEGQTDADGRFELDPVHAEGDCVLRFDEAS